MIRRICIICEGYEEFDYLTKLITLNVFSSQYEFTLRNAKGNGNVFSLYQYEYNSAYYDFVMVFIDTDVKPNKDYIIIKNKIKHFHGMSDPLEVICFSSPCIMQLILMHFSKTQLVTQDKSISSIFIKKYVKMEGVYRARDDQREAICEKISRENYFKMKRNLKTISNDDRAIPSTNYLYHASNLENENSSWIDKINEEL